MSSFVGTTQCSPGMTPSPEILAQSDLYPPDSSESGHVLPCSASAVRASEKSSIMTNRKVEHGLFYKPSTKVLRRPYLPQNGDKLPKFVVFREISTIQDEKSAAKFHYITRAKQLLRWATVWLQ